MWFLWLIGCRISGVCTAQQPAAFLHLQAPACRGGQGKRKAKQGMLISELILLLTSLQLSKHAHTCTGWDSTEEAVVVRKPCELSHTVFLSEQEPVTHSCPYPEWQDWVTDFIIMNSRELTAGCCPSLQLHSYYRPQVQTIVIKQRKTINSLTIKALKPEDSGEYTCQCRDHCTTASLKVHGMSLTFPYLHVHFNNLTKNVIFSLL